MSPEPSELSRRAVLAAVGGVGLAGFSAGLGTSATLSDETTKTGSITAGEVAVTVDCDSCVTDDGVRFDIAGIEPGSGWYEEEFQVTLPETANGARVWARTTCPEPNDPLGAALEVELLAGDCSAGGQTPVVPEAGSSADSVSLAELRRTLTDGFRIDHPSDPCLDPGETRCLTLRYRLPGDATWAVAAETTFELELYAEQCRHVDEGTVGASPFTTGPCPELECRECVELGKLDVRNDRLFAGDVYDLELSSAFDGTGEYALQVLSTTDKRDESDSFETVCASFRLLKDGSEAETPICRVTVGGGRPRSPPSDPDSRVATSDVDPPLSRTRGEVCAAHGEDKLDPERVPHGERPAISNVTVYVCADERPDPPEDDCVSCPDEGGERIVEATLEYAGPDGVSLTVDQHGQGNSPQETVTETGLDAGDAVRIPLNGGGRPDFDALVGDGDSETLVGSFHTSCSQPFGPGTVLTDGTYTLTVLEAVDRAGRKLCEVPE